MTEIRAQLLSGEQIIWEGRPFAGISFRTIDVFVAPFSLLWGDFALPWNIVVWATDAELSFKVFGLPFLIVGLYFIAGRSLVDMLIR